METIFQEQGKVMPKNPERGEEAHIYSFLPGEILKTLFWPRFESSVADKQHKCYTKHRATTTWGFSPFSFPPYITYAVRDGSRDRHGQGQGAGDIGV